MELEMEMKIEIEIEVWIDLMVTDPEEILEDKIT